MDDGMFTPHSGYLKGMNFKTLIFRKQAHFSLEVYLWQCRTLTDVQIRLPFFIEDVYNHGSLCLISGDISVSIAISWRREGRYPEEEFGS